MEAARQILPIIIQGSLAAMLLAVALEGRWADLGTIFARPALLVRAIVAVNVVVPAVAAIIILFFPLSHPVAVGLILMAVSPLAPLVPGNALQAGGRRAFVLSLYLVLILLAVVIVPVTMSILDHVFDRQAIAPMRPIAQIVLVSAVLPIAIGLTLGSALPGFARRAVPVLTFISNAVLALLVLLVFWVAGRELWSLIGDGTILAFAATTIAGLAAGHILGGPDPANRHALAVAAAIRHPGMAAAIGHLNGADKHAIVATVLFLLNGFVVTTLYKLWVGRTRSAAGSAS